MTNSEQKVSQRGTVNQYIQTKSVKQKQEERLADGADFNNLTAQYFGMKRDAFPSDAMQMQQGTERNNAENNKQNSQIVRLKETVRIFINGLINKLFSQIVRLKETVRIFINGLISKLFPQNISGTNNSPITPQEINAFYGLDIFNQDLAQTKKKMAHIQAQLSEHSGEKIGTIKRKIANREPVTPDEQNIAEAAAELTKLRRTKASIESNIASQTQKMHETFPRIQEGMTPDEVRGIYRIIKEHPEQADKYVRSKKIKDLLYPTHATAFEGWGDGGQKLIEHFQEKLLVENTFRCRKLEEILEPDKFDASSMDSFSASVKDVLRKTKKDLFGKDSISVIGKNPFLVTGQDGIVSAVRTIQGSNGLNTTYWYRGNATNGAVIITYENGDITTIMPTTFSEFEKKQPR